MHESSSPRISAHTSSSTVKFLHLYWHRKQICGNWHLTTNSIHTYIYTMTHPHHSHVVTLANRGYRSGVLAVWEATEFTREKSDSWKRGLHLVTGDRAAVIRKFIAALVTCLYSRRTKHFNAHFDLIVRGVSLQCRGQAVFHLHRSRTSTWLP